VSSFPENPEAAPLVSSDNMSPDPENLLPPIIRAAPTHPAWNGWDVLRILLMGAVALFTTVVVLLITLPGATLRARANTLSAHPELEIVGQMAAYLALLGYMYVLVTKERGCPRFWEAMHWNWPISTARFLLGGVTLQAVFLIVEWQLKRFIPKETPFDLLLRRPLSMILIAVFSITLGPLMEELFFRGFLYPVLKQRLGVAGGVFITALGFGLVHASQYGYSWLSVSLIFVVGIVLAMVREKNNSVAAGFLVHAGYNATIMMLVFLATDGFRHLEKLNR
jgi:membrane protease YdiL (CAAX protease family)